MSAGPRDVRPDAYFVPLGEAQQVYAPDRLAWYVRNLEVTPEGTLRSVRGPCPLEPVEGDPSAAQTAEVYSVFHTVLADGMADCTYVRLGDSIYRHDGSQRSYILLARGFTTGRQPRYPDVWLHFNGQVIFSDGVNPAILIRADDSVRPLGFDDIPPVPSVLCPQATGGSNRDTAEQNMKGYSWQGGIGTVGDVLSAFEGKVLAGEWEYRFIWEDDAGNLSAPSAAGSGTLRTAKANPYRRNESGSDYVGIGVEVDDLTRQFAIDYAGGAPDHAVALRVYRTGDLRNGGTVPRFLVRVPNARRQRIISDTQPDAYLGATMPDTIPVPVFRVACVHQGMLVIGNLRGAPNVVRVSEPGFGGTFRESEYTIPDVGGAEITAVASHAGRLLAFTADSTYDISDRARPVPVAQGIGCVAPQSIAALPGGALVWLARRGFCALGSGGPVEASAQIARLVTQGISQSRMISASAAVDPRTGEYRCAVSEIGDSGGLNRLILCFDGKFWREQRLGMHIAGLCATKDWRQYLLAGASDPAVSGSSGVYVLDHEIPAFTPPARDIAYRSGWLRVDATGLTPFHVRDLYIGFRDSFDGNATVTIYADGSWSPVLLGDGVTGQSVRLLGKSVPGSADRAVLDVAGVAVLGTAVAQEPRLHWRRVGVSLQNVTAWAFEIRATHPTPVEIAAFAFDTGVATGGNLTHRHPIGTET